MDNEKETAPFLSDNFLEKLDHLVLFAKKRARGVNMGEHHSARDGGSLEFLDYRTYQPGDDLRYVDWNVYGRLDRLYIKLFKAEKEQSIYILLDMSLSMSTGNPTKERYAKQVAAALSYICLANMDRVMVSAFNDRIQFFKAPERGRQVYFSIIELLENLKPEGQTNLNDALTEFAASIKQNGIVIILSDLLDPAGLENGLKALSYKKLDIHVIHILDREELSPTLSGYVQLEDIEFGGNKTMSIDRPILESYQDKLQNYLNRIKTLNHTIGGNYFLTDTRIPFNEFLINYLTQGHLIR